MAAMQEEGAVAAISVCAEEAPVIAREVSDETGYEVSRTALRVRNAANAPDRWEQAQLEDYIRRVQAGEAVASMETASVAMTAGEPIFRWAKPIDMKPLCATCHGVEIAPLLREAINARYPNDAATGFSEGEVRGIFTVQRALSEADG